MKNIRRFQATLCLLGIFAAASIAAGASVCTPAPAGIIGWWRAENSTNDWVFTNNCAITNSVTYVPGKVGQAFSFNDANADVTIPGNDVLDVGSNALGFTVEAWIKPTEVQALHPIFEWQVPIKGDDGVSLRLVGGALQGNIYNFYADDHQISSSNNLVVPNVFQHVALTYNRTNGLATLYYNGAMIAQTNVGIFSPYTPGDLSLGRRGWGYYDNSSYNFLGLIDEPAVYNRPLGADEIAAIYNADSAGKCTDVKPWIYGQPTNQIVGSGNDANVSLIVIGSAPLSYQWWGPTGSIAGATNPALTVPDTQVSDSGNYYVVISNPAGSVTSSNALLTITNQPVYITQQPQGTSTVATTPFTFSVGVGGSKPTYQWQLNNTNISGATNATYTIPSLQTSDSGNYSVVLRNSYGPSVTSSNALLVVSPVPFTAIDNFDSGVDPTQWSDFGGDPATYIYYGGNGAGNAAGSASPPNSLWFGYNGYRYNGFPGDRRSRYATTRLLDTTRGGQIDFAIRLAYGSAPPWWSPISLPGAAIVLEYSVDHGSDWTQITQYATYNPYTNWTSQSIPIPAGAMAPAALFRWRQLTNSGPYKDSWALDSVNVGAQPPMISSQPSNVTLMVGQNATFNVGVTSGTPTISYQWRFNGNPINGATNTSYVLSNAQFTSAGNYSVAVSNVASVVLSSNAVLTVIPAVTIVQAVNANVTAGNSFDEPVNLVAYGNENALSFSLKFDTNLLQYASITTGSGAGNALLLPNLSLLYLGKIGVQLALPAGQTFTPGTQEIVRVTFNSSILTGTQSVATAMTFVGLPLPRDAADVNGQPLNTNFVDGVVTLAPSPLEGDVSSVPSSAGNLDVFDWVEVGRLVAGLDTVTNGAEFQKADCAPRNTLGDGQLKVTDWVQAGRYAAGLDPLTLAGGPTALVPNLAPLQPNTPNARQVVVNNGSAVKGLTMTLPISLMAQGDETALGFSMNFDPTVLRDLTTTNGDDAANAVLNVNTNQAALGTLAIVAGLQTSGAQFTAGTKEIAKVTFMAIATTTNNSVTFADQPVVRSISDTNATELTASYVGSSIVVNPQPTLTLSSVGDAPLLSWPVWAGDFTVQATGNLTPPITWTNVPVTLQTNGDAIQISLPAPTQQIFFRLYHP